MGRVSDDLVAFLTARLDEDEAMAAATPGIGFQAQGLAWHEVDPDRQAGRIEDDCGYVVVYDEGAPTADQAAHIARHDPARVLREVAFKRTILAGHYPGATWAHDAPEGLKICAGEEGDGDTWQMATRWPCPEIRALAAVWSDHPEWRPEWAPE
jgi:Family of unknown function (DUF6221)